MSFSSNGEEEDRGKRSRSRSSEREKEREKKREDSDREGKRQSKIKLINLNIQIFNDTNLEQIPSIKNYIINIENENNDEAYLKKNDMNSERLNRLLESYYKSNKINEFLNCYAKNQFLLSYEKRILYQDNIKTYQNKGYKISNIISQNFINEPIKNIFKEIGISIINLSQTDENINYNKIKEQFKKKMFILMKNLNSNYLINMGL